MLSDRNYTIHGIELDDADGREVVYLPVTWQEQIGDGMWPSLPLCDSDPGPYDSLEEFRDEKRQLESEDYAVILGEVDFWISPDYIQMRRFEDMPANHREELLEEFDPGDPVKTPGWLEEELSSDPFSWEYVSDQFQGSFLNRNLLTYTTITR